MVFFNQVHLLHAQAPKSDRIRGITMVAPPNRWEEPPVDDIEDLNADWIAVVPYGFTEAGGTSVVHNLDWQWWGEREAGVRESIRMARANGVKVMLKPQVYIHRGWVGEMDFDTENEWMAWERSYREFILHYAHIAQEEQADILCVGTEYKIAVRKRAPYWKKLIQEIRELYDGELTYSANWDSYTDCPIWSDLDYIGLSAYFPLVPTSTPQVKDLVKAWEVTEKTLEKFSMQHQKKILFTEYGYMSVDGCAYRAWEIEKDLDNRKINQQAQSNAYEALLLTYWDNPWWAGGFIWKVFPHMKGHEGYPEKDYTPQGKIAQHTIARYYAQPD